MGRNKMNALIEFFKLKKNENKNFKSLLVDVYADNRLSRYG